MTGGRETTHIGADFGEDGLRRQVADTWYRAQETDQGAKGGLTGRHLRVHLGNRCIDLVIDFNNRFLNMAVDAAARLYMDRYAAKALDKPAAYEQIKRLEMSNPEPSLFDEMNCIAAETPGGPALMGYLTNFVACKKAAVQASATTSLTIFSCCGANGVSASCESKGPRRTPTWPRFCASRMIRSLGVMACRRARSAMP